MKNKGLVITLGVLVLLIISGLGFFYIASSHKTTSPVKEIPVINDAPVPSLSPDAIGFSMALAQTGQSAGHAVDINVTKLDGITGIDYEFSYIYSGDLNQGGFGHLDIKPGESEASQEIVLGTCSSGTCRYDAGVSHFKVILRVIKNDGKTYQVEKEMDL